MNDEQLKYLCQTWQNILGLSHWNIDVKIVPGAEINDNCGQNDYKIADEMSLIRLEAPEDYHGYFPYDMEVVLVHELLHLVLDMASGIEMNYLLYEQALTRIARAMVYLKRSKEKC